MVALQVFVFTIVHNSTLSCVESNQLQQLLQDLVDSILDGCMWLHQGQIQKAGWVTTKHIALTTTAFRK